MLTPKEKAVELYSKFYYTIPTDEMSKDEGTSKQCALIAVDEIIKSVPIAPLELSHPALYWHEVKQEILNL